MEIMRYHHQGQNFKCPASKSSPACWWYTSLNNQEINVSLLNAKDLEALTLKTSWQFSGQNVNTSKHYKDKNIALYYLCHSYCKKKNLDFSSAFCQHFSFYFTEIHN